MTKSTPLPCPFCAHVGLTFEIVRGGRWGRASCENCEVTRGDVRIKDGDDTYEWCKVAIDDWNTRSVVPDSPKPIPVEYIEIQADLFQANVKTFMQGVRWAEKFHGIYKRIEND